MRARRASQISGKHNKRKKRRKKENGDENIPRYRRIRFEELRTSGEVYPKGVQINEKRYQKAILEAGGSKITCLHKAKT